MMIRLLGASGVGILTGIACPVLFMLAAVVSLRLRSIHYGSIGIGATLLLRLFAGGFIAGFAWMILHTR